MFLSYLVQTTSVQLFSLLVGHQGDLLSLLSYRLGGTSEDLRRNPRNQPDFPARISVTEPMLELVVPRTESIITGAVAPEMPLLPLL